MNERFIAGIVAGAAFGAVVILPLVRRANHWMDAGGCLRQLVGAVVFVIAFAFLLLVLKAQLGGLP